MNILGQLRKARIENVPATQESDSKQTGRVTYNKADGSVEIDSGAEVKKLSYTDHLHPVVDFEEQAVVPENPESGWHKFFKFANGKFCSVDSEGAIAPIGGGAGSSEIYGILKAEEDDLSTFLDGLIDCTFEKEVDNPLSGDSSYKVTMGASAYGDLLTKSFEVKPRSRNNINKASVIVDFDGNDNDWDFRLVYKTAEVTYNEFDDARVWIKKLSAHQETIYFYMPHDAVEVFGVFTAHNGNLGKVLQFNDFELSDNAINTSSYTSNTKAHYILNSSYDISSTSFDTGVASCLTVDDSTYSDSVQFTAVSKCTVSTVARHIGGGSNAQGSIAWLYTPSGGSELDISQSYSRNYGASASADNAPFNLELDAGDTIRAKFTSITSFAAASITINAKYESSGVIHTSDISLEEWTKYTPITQGLGTITNDEVFWRQVGDSYEVRGRFNVGTVASSEIQIGLPNDGAVSSAVTNFMLIGDVARGTDGVGNYKITATGGDAYLNVVYNGTANNISDGPKTGVSLFGSGDQLHFFANVPIEGLSGGHKYAITPLTKTAYIKTHATNYGSALSSSTSYKAHNLDSVVGESFASVTANQLTLPAGLYDISIPVSKINGGGVLDLLIYDVGNSVNIEELLEVASDLTGVAAITFSNVEAMLDLAVTTKIDFRTKSTDANGSDYLGRIKITKLL